MAPTKYASIVDEIVDRAEALLGLTLGLAPLLSSMRASAVSGNEIASAGVGAHAPRRQDNPVPVLQDMCRQRTAKPAGGSGD
jgi:hypothetical protein